MSIQIKRLSASARVPTSNFDGSYDIYSSECRTIGAGSSTVVSSGFMISLPIGYYGIVGSCELSTSSGIETGTFAGIHYHNYKKSFKQVKAGAELILVLRNFGLVNMTINPGDLIGRLVLVRTNILGVREVTEFEEEIYTKQTPVTSGRALPTYSKTALPKNAETWFKLRYRDDPDVTVSRYFGGSPDLIDSIFKFKQTLVDMPKKDIIESNFVWNLLPVSKTLEVENDYEAFRAELLSKPESPESSPKLKPKLKPKSKPTMPVKRVSTPVKLKKVISSEDELSE